MKLLFSTGSLYDRPLDYVAYVAASSGFDGIELVLNGVWYDKELYKKIMFLERVLPIQAIHAPFDAKSFKEKSISLQKTLEIALDTDAKVVVVHPPNIKLFDFRYYSWFNRYLDKVSFKFDICVEVMPLSLISFFGRIIRVPLYSFSSFTELREFVSSKGLKIAFDTTHVFTYGVSLIDAFEALGSINTIAHVHLSDFTFSKSVCKQH
ncbi:MAG: sugar phosphate isomerase/epimerase, partial [candidate division WOR-3 bacterium]